MGFPKDYAKAMYSEFNHQVIWPPNRSVKLGDYGTVSRTKKDGKSFDRLGNVASLKDKDGKKVTFDVRKGNKAKVQKYESKGVSKADVSGDYKGAGYDVAVKIGFSKKNTMLYHASNVVLHEIKDMTGFGKQLAKLRKQKRFDRHWFVVTKVHVAEGATILLSREKSTSATLAGNAKLTIGDLGNAQAEAKFVAQNSGLVDYRMEHCTPLLEARKVGRKGLKLAEEGDEGPVLTTGIDLLDVDPEFTFGAVEFDYCDIDEGEELFTHFTLEEA